MIEGHFQPNIYSYHDTMILLRAPDVYCSCAESGITAEAVVGAGTQEETIHVHCLVQGHPFTLQGNSWWIGMFQKI